MEVQKEQRHVIKFCVRLQKSGVETLAMQCQCYGEHYLGCATILRWHAKFTADLKQSVALQLHSRCKVSVGTETTVNKIAIIIREDRHLSVQCLKSQIHIPKTMLHRILRDDLGMWRVCSTWVPHMLTREQLNTHLEMCQENLHINETDPDYLNTSNNVWWTLFRVQNAVGTHYLEDALIAKGEKGDATGIGRETHAHGLLSLAGPRIPALRLLGRVDRQVELPESAAKSVWAHCKEAPSPQKEVGVAHNNARPHISKEVTAF